MREFADDLSAALLTSTGYAAATYPLHRVKVLLQTQDGHPDIQSGKVPRFQFLTSFSRLIREQGWRSLWRGCTPYMLRHVPSTSLSFALKDWLQRVMPAPDAHTQPWQYSVSKLLAGGTAGVLALAVVYPLDLANIRMAARFSARHQGTLTALAGSKPALSVRSVYKGFGVSAVAIGGYKALYLGLYDICKVYCLPPSSEQPDVSQPGQHQHHDATSLTSRLQRPGELLYMWAVASGVVYIATTVTYPLDVVRKRYVVDAGRPTQQYTSALHCLRVIAKQEGLKGLYRFYGYDMLLRLGAGILLVAYDEVRDHLHDLRAAAAI